MTVIQYNILPEFDKPKVGEVRDAKEIGHSSNVPYIWQECSICGKGRWIQKRSDMRNKCISCSIHLRMHKKHILINRRRYYAIYVNSDDFYAPMISSNKLNKYGGYILEHRLVMAKHLGRCLHPWEVVHHKNGIKDDNRIENLELTTKNTHSTDHSHGYRDGYRKGYQDGANTQIRELKAEIRLLRFELSHKSEV